MSIEGHTRHENDAYYTNPLLVDGLMERPFMRKFHPRSVLEPMVGTGNVLDAVLKAKKDCVGNAVSNDVEFGVYGNQTYCGDALDPDHPMWQTTYHLVITNPAANQTNRLLPLAWESTSRMMIMLLPISFLEPTKPRGNDPGRRAFWEQAGMHLMHIVVANPRPRFVPGSTQTHNVTHAWFVWDRLHKWGDGRMSFGTENPFQFLLDWR